MATRMRYLNMFFESKYAPLKSLHITKYIIQVGEKPLVIKQIECNGFKYGEKYYYLIKISYKDQMTFDLIKFSRMYSMKLLKKSYLNKDGVDKFLDISNADLVEENYLEL